MTCSMKVFAVTSDNLFIRVFPSPACEVEELFLLFHPSFYNHTHPHPQPLVVTTHHRTNDYRGTYLFIRGSLILLVYMCDRIGTRLY